jgi:acyl-CoA dehydrogenase
VFNDCRIPYDNILGSPEVVKGDAEHKGFKGAMKFVLRGGKLHSRN